MSWKQKSWVWAFIAGNSKISRTLINSGNLKVLFHPDRDKIICDSACSGNAKIASVSLRPWWLEVASYYVCYFGGQLMHRILQRNLITFCFLVQKVCICDLKVKIISVFYIWSCWLILTHQDVICTSVYLKDQIMLKLILIQILLKMILITSRLAKG